MPSKRIEFHSGMSRIVLLIGRYAVKVPRLSGLARIKQGLNCNQAEVDAWRQQHYPNLCPLLWATPGPFLLVMARARSMSDAEFDEWFDSDDWPHLVDQRTPFELKSADAGVLPDGRRVLART